MEVDEENKNSGHEGPLVFEITSAHISETSENEKKYVAYTLQVRHLSGGEGAEPSIIERRYTHFYNLYNALKSEEPELMSNVAFPRKVLIGNFDNKLISTRSTGFESLLKFISAEPKLRTSPALASFLQDVELAKAKELIAERQFFFALPTLENIFKLLSKVFTDRSTPILLALCRVVGCCAAIPGTPNDLKWAELAIHRYDGVSDSDLLELYIPLLHTCIKILRQHEKDCKNLEDRLLELKQKGVRIDDSMNLLEAVDNVEQKLSSTKSSI